MPPPMQIKSFNEMQQNIASVQQDVADYSSMQSASDELRNMANVTNLVKKKKKMNWQML